MCELNGTKCAETHEKRTSTILSWTIVIGLGAMIGALFTIVNGQHDEISMSIDGMWIVIDLMMASLAILIFTITLAAFFRKHR